MEIGKCKLCLQTKELLRESHIIPRFLYKLLTDENNSIVMVDSERARLFYNSEYEANILCKDCDNGVIGKLDDYFAKYLHGEFPEKQQTSFITIEGIEHVVRENDPNYSYAKYKLFLLSLLWRSSISTRKFFDGIKLSLETEEELRKMIINNVPGEPDQYSCFIFLPPLISTPNGGRGFHTFYMPTMSPVTHKNADWEICKFVIEGMTYYFVISRPVTSKVEPSVDKNKLLMRISTVKEQSEMHDLMLKMAMSHKKRK